MWPGQMCMCVSNRDRRGFVRFIGTWTGWYMNRKLNWQTLLDYPPSQLPFNSFLSERNEALLMCEHGVMCCFQPVKCTARLLCLPPLHLWFKDLALGWREVINRDHLQQSPLSGHQRNNPTPPSYGPPSLDLIFMSSEESFCFFHFLLSINNK